MTDQHPIHAAPAGDRAGGSPDSEPGPQARRGGRPSPRRDHLVEVATDLFCREGFHATGIDRVLAESGVAKMTLYKHFPSKDDLIGACLESVAASARADVESVLERGGSTARARILTLIDWYVGLAVDCEFTGCPFHHARAEFADPSHPAYRVARDQKLWMRGRLRELCAEHGLRGPELCADQLMLVIEGALSLGALDISDELAQASAALARKIVDGAKRS